MKYLLETEQRQLLKVLRDSKSSMRDLTIVELTLHTGLRIQELRLLNVGDIFNGMTIRSHIAVRAETAKRSKEREVFLNSHISKYLKEFIRYKKSLNESLEPSSPLFISKKKNRMGQRSLQNMIEKYLIKSGLVDTKGKSKYSFHSLRHSFAQNLRRRNVSLERIQKLLGHSSLQSTTIYVEPNREDLIEAAQTLVA